MTAHQRRLFLSAEVNTRGEIVGWKNSDKSRLIRINPGLFSLQRTYAGNFSTKVLSKLIWICRNFSFDDFTLFYFPQGHQNFADPLDKDKRALWILPLREQSLFEKMYNPFLEGVFALNVNNN